MSKESEAREHEEAYDQGREEAKEDSLPEQVLHGAGQMVIDTTIPDFMKDSKAESREAGYRDQSSGQNNKDDEDN